MLEVAPKGHTDFHAPAMLKGLGSNADKEEEEEEG